MDDDEDAPPLMNTDDEHNTSCVPEHDVTTTTASIAAATGAATATTPVISILDTKATPVTNNAVQHSHLTTTETEASKRITATETASNHCQTSDMELSPPAGILKPAVDASQFETTLKSQQRRKSVSFSERHNYRVYTLCEQEKAC